VKITSRPLTVLALLLGIFLAAMEMTVVSTAMPTVVGELGGLPLYAWAFAAYLLSTTVTVPIHGKLADLLGRKPVLLAGIALFLVGSAGCATSGTMGALIAWRTVQGVGAGAMQPVAMTIVGDLYRVSERARIQGLIGAVWGIAGLVGPVLGGAIVDALGWRWIFWINLPFGLASAAVLAAAYHERPERHEHRLDLAGAALLSVGVVALLLAVRSPAVGLAAVPVSAGALALFVAVERRAKEPLLPLDLFREKVIAVSSVTGGLVGAGMLTTVTFVPLWVQSILGTSPTTAGAAIAPMAVGWPIASTIAGRLLVRAGYRRLLLTGLTTSALAATGLALLLRPGTPVVVPQALTFAYGLGLGLANTPLIVAVQTSVAWNRRGVATASTLFFRTIGGTIALGVLGGVLAHALAGAGAGPGVAERLLGPERASLPAAELSAVSGALQRGMRIVFWSVAAIATAALASATRFPRVAVADAAAPPGAGAAPAAPADRT
jgi:EmrB/QacA subfamily drug resistance transporter